MSLPSSTPRLTFLMLAFVSLAFAVAVIPLASLSTYAAVSALLLAFLIVTVTTAINAQPTGSLGQLIYETEYPRRVATRERDATNAARVYRW